MKKYFGVNLEFNHAILEDIVKRKSVNSKGYSCFVDANSLVYSYKNKNFKNILNNSLVNSCDGSYIAILASKIHKKNLKEYIGPDFFKKFIYHNNKHLIVGNTKDVFKKIKRKVKNKNGNTDNLNYLSIPFLRFDEFDYIEISKFINKLNPDYIWVSLGAPKQEFFMSKLLPYLNRGVMLGVGAATNYFSGEIKDIPQWTKKLHIIWLYRLFTEPEKQLKRLKSILAILPKVIKEEIKKVKNIN